MKMFVFLLVTIGVVNSACLAGILCDNNGQACPIGLTCQNIVQPFGIGECCSDDSASTTLRTMFPGFGTTPTMNPFYTTRLPIFGTLFPSIATNSVGCQDLRNPFTGISDCPSRLTLCNDPNYFDLMSRQCPQTCGRCGLIRSTRFPSIFFTTISPTYGSCVDRINTRTGFSDCPMQVRLCFDTIYQNLMRIQCPKTCGFCNQHGLSTQRSTRRFSTFGMMTSSTPRFG